MSAGVAKPIILSILIMTAFVIVSCGMDVQRRKEQAEIHSNLGIAYIESGDFGNALKELLSAEVFTPNDPKIHYFLAMAYAGKGYGEKALEECQKAVDLKPDYAEAHNYLGTLYLNNGNTQAAIDAFQRALSIILYDTPAIALYNMGRAYVVRKEYDKAMAKYQEAAAKDTKRAITPLIMLEMGRVSMLQGDEEKAVDYLKKSVDLVPNFVEAYYLLADCYARQGKKVQARESLETIVKLAPNSEIGRLAKQKLDGKTL